MTIPTSSPLNPPHFPQEENEIGSYVRKVFVEEGWKEMDVILHFSGVKSIFFVWVNGKFVGGSQDSYTPSEVELLVFFFWLLIWTF